MILILDIKKVTLKSSDESVFGLSDILNATSFARNEINQVIVLAINIYHSVKFSTSVLFKLMNRINLGAVSAALRAVTFVSGCMSSVRIVRACGGTY